MSQKLTRRRFGQLAIAGTAGVALSTLAKKTSAQTSLVINGVHADDGAKLLDVTQGRVLNPRSALVSNQSRLTQQPRERLTGLSYLSDGTLIQSSNSITTEENKPKTSTITFFGNSPKKLTVLGLPANQTVESFVVTNNDSLLALIGQSNGAPPFRLANINRNTGQISFINFTLPANQRFGTLAQCPDGRIYAISLGRLGETSLVRLDLQQGEIINLAQLTYNGTVWDNGLRSLACSPAGQLFALGAIRYETTNSVYTVDPRTGVMTLLREFDVNNIAFPRT